MLLLTRLNGPVFALNPDLIERADATPDTVITLVNGTRYVIAEPLDELARLVRDYRAETAAAAFRSPTSHRMLGTGPDRPADSALGTVVELRPGDL